MKNQFQVLFIPETNLLFTKDNRYPVPTSSNSMPDNVVPSQLNCVLSMAGFDGPLATSSRARNVSIPLLSECWEISVKFHTNRLDSPSLRRMFVSILFMFCLMIGTYHAECGFDCTFLTPPSTGTFIDTFKRGDGDAIA